MSIKSFPTQGREGTRPGPEAPAATWVPAQQGYHSREAPLPPPQPPGPLVLIPPAGPGCAGPPGGCWRALRCLDRPHRQRQAAAGSISRRQEWLHACMGGATLQRQAGSPGGGSGRSGCTALLCCSPPQRKTKTVSRFGCPDGACPQPHMTAARHPAHLPITHPLINRLDL